MEAAQPVVVAAVSALGLELNGLYDLARLRRELGVSRAAAEKIMFALPKQYVPGVRKVWVRGTDVERLLDENLRRP